MQLDDTLAASTKRVVKMTSKAKAALEEKGTRSKKRKPDSSGDNAMNPQPKKTKINLLAGNARTTDKDRSLSSSPTPPVASQHAVVHTDDSEEEAALYTDDEEIPKDSDDESQVNDEDELGALDNLHNNISTFKLIKYE